MTLRPYFATKLSMPFARAFTIAFCLISSVALAEDTVSIPLLSTSKTTLDQPIAYPTTGKTIITARTTTFPPGASTAPHRHDVPLLTYILEGTLTIDYGAAGIKSYKTGEFYVEAVGTTHTGKNLGSVPVKILAVYLGADGVENTTLAIH
jgi:quercetin dioxygenase-like cupin family protein